MDSRLVRTVQALREPTRGVGIDYVFGAAAAALCGADISPREVELVCTVQEARQILERFGAEDGGGDGDGPFYAAVFERIEIEGGLPLVIMGGVELFEREAWRPVWFFSRGCVLVEGVEVWMPEVWEQIEVLKRFGREKDLALIPLLERLPDYKPRRWARGR